MTSDLLSSLCNLSSSHHPHHLLSCPGHGCDQGAGTVCWATRLDPQVVHLRRLVRSTASAPPSAYNSRDAVAVQPTWSVTMGLRV
jgi:hypothetical protein